MDGIWGDSCIAGGISTEDGDEVELTTETFLGFGRDFSISRWINTRAIAIDQPEMLAFCRRSSAGACQEPQIAAIYSLDAAPVTGALTVRLTSLMSRITSDRWENPPFNATMTTAAGESASTHMRANQEDCVNAVNHAALTQHGCKLL